MRHLSKLLAVFAFLMAGHCLADAAYELDLANSSVSFVSVKNKDISEVHTFDSFSGSVSDTGAVLIRIDAESINTMIPIRDERMQEHLFSVASFPTIDIRAQVDLGSMQTGVQRMQLPTTVSLVGKDLAVQLDVLVSSSDAGLIVSSTKPVVVHAAQAGLAEGIAKLAELAGGISIGSSTPVSFVLSFERP